MGDVIIAKGGGTSAATGLGFTRMAYQLRKYDLSRIAAFVVSGPGAYTDKNDPERRLARDMQKGTDVLLDAVREFRSGRRVGTHIADIAQRFDRIEQNTGIVGDRRASTQVEAAVTNALANQRWDEVAAIGELLNAPLFAAFLNEAGIPAAYVHPKDLGMRVIWNAAGKRWVVDREAYEDINRRIMELRAAGRLVITAGFCGVDSEGNIRVFERGGSDYTQAELARAVRATLALNMTDVANVCAAEPSMVAKPAPNQVMTLDEISELTLGRKFGVLQEDAVIALADAGIPIKVIDTFNDTEGTYIGIERRIDPDRPIVGVAARGDFLLIKVRRPGMGDEVGIYDRISRIFADQGISLEDFPAARHRLGILVDAKSVNGSLEAIVRRIEVAVESKKIEVVRDITIVNVVGEGIDKMVGVGERIFRALRGANAASVATRSFDLACTLAIQTAGEGNGTGISDTVRRVVSGIHREFFEERHEWGLTPAAAEERARANLLRV